MKRHQKLQDLSREHYSALKLALQAKRAALSGDPREIESATTACITSFRLELDPHFLVEEQTLLPILLASGEHRVVQRVEADHAELRRLAGGLLDPDTATLLAFAELLTSHVRFEEREMFEILESYLESSP